MRLRANDAFLQLRRDSFVEELIDLPTDVLRREVVIIHGSQNKQDLNHFWDLVVSWVSMQP